MATVDWIIIIDQFLTNSGNIICTIAFKFVKTNPQLLNYFIKRLKCYSGIL